MISFSIPTPTPNADPQLPVQHSSPDSGSSAEGDKPFDSFLDTNQVLTDPKPKALPAQSRSQSVTKSATSTNSSDTTSGNEGGLSHLRHLKGDKNTILNGSETTSNPTVATIAATSKKGVVDQGDVPLQKSTNPTLNDQIATALMSASQPGITPLEGMLTFTPDLNTPSSGIVVDPKSFLANSRGLSTNLRAMPVPANGAVQESVTPGAMPVPANGAVQESVTPGAMPIPANGTVQESVTPGAMPVPANGAVQESVTSGAMPVPANGAVQESVTPGAMPVPANGAVQESVTSGAMPVPANGAVQGMMTSGGVSLATGDGVQVPSTTVQSVVQLGMSSGKSLDQLFFDRAKNAGMIKRSVIGTDQTMKEGAQSSFTQGETKLSTDTGTSIAMQHGVMSDTNVHSQTKAGSPSSAEDTEIVTPVDSKLTSSMSGKNAENFGHGQKSEDGSTGGFVQDLSNLQVQQTKEGIPSITGSSVAAAPQTNLAQRAETIVKQVIDSASSMTSDGRSNVELQVKLRDGTEISIKLQMTEGRIQPTFKTDSTELRQAIEQNWAQFSSKSASGNSLIANPVFESPKMNSGANDLSQQQQGGRQQSSETWAGESSGFGFGQFQKSNRGQEESVLQQTASSISTQAAPKTGGLDLYA